MLITNMREKRPDRGRINLIHFASIVGLLVVLLLSFINKSNAQQVDQVETLTESEVVKIASRWFGMSSESIAEVMDVIFNKHGGPSAYIRGEEAGGAFIFGARYGRGELVMSDGHSEPVYWRGPTIGPDYGGNAAKTFTLIYNLQNPDDLFRRYPGVDGSAFFIAGLAVNFQERGDVILAPIRAGVGGRLGVNVGYLKYSRKPGKIPF